MATTKVFAECTAEIRNHEIAFCLARLSGCGVAPWKVLCDPRPVHTPRPSACSIDIGVYDRDVWPCLGLASSEVAGQATASCTARTRKRNIL